MDRDYLYKLIDKPDESNAGDLKELELLVQQYPWFSAGRVLHLKTVHNLKDIRYQEILRKTAPYAGSRRRLRELVEDADLLKAEMPLVQSPVDEPMPVGAAVFTESITEPELVPEVSLSESPVIPEPIVTELVSEPTAVIEEAVSKEPPVERAASLISEIPVEIVPVIEPAVEPISAQQTPEPESMVVEENVNVVVPEPVLQEQPVAATIIVPEERIMESVAEPIPAEIMPEPVNIVVEEKVSSLVPEAVVPDSPVVVPIVIPDMKTMETKPASTADNILKTIAEIRTVKKPPVSSGESLADQILRKAEEARKLKASKTQVSEEVAKTAIKAEEPLIVPPVQEPVNEIPLVIPEPVAPVEEIIPVADMPAEIPVETPTQTIAEVPEEKVEVISVELPEEVPADIPVEAVPSIAATEEPQISEPVESSPIIPEVISVEEVVELPVEPEPELIPEVVSEVHVVESVAEIAEPAPVESQPAPQEEFKLRKNILGSDDGLAALSALYSTGYDITRLEPVPEKPVKKADIRTGQKSFNDWLQAFSGTESPADSPVTGNIHKEKQKELLEAFIKNEPRIRVTPASQPSVSLVDKQDDNQPLPASETLASLLEKQGHYDKAIKMYRDLILKYPEKNTYFANLIFTIEEKLKTDKSN